MNQPAVSPEFVLLASSYPIGNLLVDLYGERPDAYSGHNVCGLVVSGTTVNLFDLVDQYKLNALSRALDAADDLQTGYRLPPMVLPAMLRVQAAV